jgi:RHS repeat-associated protein
MQSIREVMNGRGRLRGYLLLAALLLPLGVSAQTITVAPKDVYRDIRPDDTTFLCIGGRIGTLAEISAPVLACMNATLATSTTRYQNLRQAVPPQSVGGLPANLKADIIYVPANLKVGEFPVASTLDHACPRGYPPAGSLCQRAATEADLEKNDGDPEQCCGNPINPGTGVKFQTETDYRREQPFPFAFSRYYNSSAAPTGSFGAKWRSVFDGTVESYTASGVVTAYLRRPSGKVFHFTQSGGLWTSDADVTHALSQVSLVGVTYWKVTTQDDRTELYSVASGKLVSITDRGGYAITLAYNPNTQAIAATDSFGHALQFTYNAAGRVATLIDPTGGTYAYQYDGNGYLTSVTYPDSSLRQYLYEGPYAGGLTGLLDENNSRFATWTYNAQGQALSSQHAGGVELTTVAYGTNAATVTDAYNSVRGYSFGVVQGLAKTGAITGPACPQCGPAAKTYDANGFPASATDWNGNLTQTTYNSRGLETQRIEAVGTPQQRTTTTEWHAGFRLPTTVATPLKLATYGYDALGGLLTRTEQATTDVNGGQGLSPTVTGSPRTWTWTYNSTGQVLTANGPRTDVTDVTTYTYYPANDATVAKRGNLATLANAQGHLTQITAYDGNGRPLTVIDPNNVTLAFTYTPRGWLQTSSIAGQTTTYAYDAVGQLTGLTRPDGSQVSYDYDPAHRLTAIGDGAGNRVEFTRDALGNVTHTAWLNPDSSTARSRRATFDALGRLQAAIDTRNAVEYTTTHGYDANGNPTTVTDPKSNLTTTQYDALNRPTRITDALLGLTTLAYDARGQLTQFKAPNNAQTNFTVDGLGNVTAEASADRGSLTATYDAAGNLLTLSDARGIVETHTYDALNRPLTVSYPTTGENLAYTWDSFAGCANGVGRLCGVADNGGSTAYAYDERGNPVAETRTEGGIALAAVQYTWDGADRISAEITATGKLLTTQRDTDGRIQQLSTAVGATPQVNLVSAVQQNAAGNTVAQTFGNGVTEARSYATDGLPVNAAVTEPGGGGGEIGGDGDVPTLPEWGLIILGALLLGIGYRKQHGGGTGWPGRLAGVLAVVLVLPLLATSPAALANETLSYDANGNIQTRTLSGGTTTYGYDALNRINSEAGPAKTQSLTYDPNDNRLTDSAGSKTYTANTDRLVTENGQSVTLDAAGNVTQARGLNFVWNQRAGQVRTVSQGATLLATYTYDYKGRRTRKITTAAAPQGAGTVVYHYDLQGRLIAETTPAGNPIFTYVWRDDVPVSIIVHGTSETALYLETDHLNTPIAARDQSGKVVWKWESDAFGTTLPNEDPDGDTQKTTINLRFPGQYFDRESGLHYNWNRYYDPRLGRYMSPDVIGIRGGANLFGYVRQNSLNNIDPTGLTPPWQSIQYLPRETLNSLVNFAQRVPSATAALAAVTALEMYQTTVFVNWGAAVTAQSAAVGAAGQGAGGAFYDITHPDDNAQMGLTKPQTCPR